MKRKFCLLLAALCIFLGGCASDQQTAQAPELLEPAGVELDYAAVQMMDLYTVTPYSASVVPHVEDMSFAVDGRVETVHVSLGSSVKQGDKLITLNEEELLEEEADLIEEIDYTRKIYANANETAQIDIQIAKLELDKMKKNGADAAALSSMQANIDMQELILRQTQQEQDIALADLEAQLAAVQEKIGKNVLYAPFDGVIISIEDLREDEYVQAYDIVLRIADESRIHIASDFITENSVKNAHEIYALIGESKYALEYMPIDMEEYLNAVFSGAALRTEFSFAGDSEGVFCGDFAAVCVVSGYTPDALSIPVNALYTDSTGRYVYRLEGDQRVRVNVHTGASNSLYIQITEGLEEGDLVYVKE